MNFTDEDILFKIRENKLKLEKLLQKAISTKNESAKLKILSDAATFASCNVCNCLSSSKIENELLNVSKKHNISISENYEENSFLHVMTEAYNIGGHSRVVERWIKNSPVNQKHSVILTKQIKQSEIPEKLRQNVKEKNGEFIVLDKKNSFVKSALELRKIASSYENVILHVHMNDIIPILAFGNENFRRPVVYFNHADHVFWLGVSISDLVVNLRTFSSHFNEKYRHIKNNAVLPLPVDSENLENIKKDTEQIIRTKQELGFNPNSKVILTMASPYKYVPFNDYDFIKTMTKILEKTSDTVLLAIGPSKSEENWADAFVDSNKRINAIGMIEHQNLEKYLAISDLAVDSFPFSSFTALLDIAKYNIPSIALKTPLNDLDSFNEAGIFSETQEQLVDKAVELLNQSNVNENKLFDIMQKYHFEENFKKELVNLYKIFPKEHKLRIFKNDENQELSELEIFICKNNIANYYQNSYVEKPFLVIIPNLLKIEEVKINNVKRLNVDIFGFKLSFRLK